MYFCFIDYAKDFDCVDHNKLWKTLKEMGKPDHLIYLLITLLYAGQEATVRTRHGTMDWFQIGKGVCQGCILSPCLLNLYAEYIMRNAGLDETQAGIKINGRNINNLRYADDFTTSTYGLPGGTSGKELPCQCRRLKRTGLDPWVGKISWRRKW